MGLDDFAPGIKAYYEGCTTMAEIAQKAAAMEGGDFVVLNLEGGDPNGVNKSTEELIAIVKEVADAIDCPLVLKAAKMWRRMRNFFRRLQRHFRQKRDRDV